ncbi:MAG: S9 family peptidase [Planctomycetes bacterium]|nr:S9 family peptidase [Planctomycetota bacterium]
MITSKHHPLFRLLGCLLIAFVVAVGCNTSHHGNDESAKTEDKKLTYPKTRKGDHLDDYHGRKIADPYRWLEDADSQETTAWVKAQNELTFGFLKNIPQREAIRKRLTKLWNYERFGTPRRRGGRYFYSRNDGLQNQSVLYTAHSLDEEPRVLLDPNTLSDDGTVALSGQSVSDDGRLMAYGLSTAGSDWQEWKVLDVATGKHLADHLKWIKFSSASWTSDGKGFYYSRYDEPKEDEKLTGTNYFQKLYYHRIGEKQEKDRLVYERPDEKEWGFSGDVTEDGRYLVIGVWRGSERKNQVFIKHLANNDTPVVELITGFDSQYAFVGNDGEKLYFRTDSGAPRGRLIAVNLSEPLPTDWQQVIPQADEVLQDVNFVGDRFISLYLKDAQTQVKVFDTAGKLLREVELPGIGSAGGFGGRREDRETFYWFTSYTAPATIYRYDVETGESTLFRQPKVDFDPNRYETRQVFYNSKDGTRVPMFVTLRKGLKLDGSNPTLLNGYGGFNISLTPSFTVRNAIWLEMGGIYAVPNLRGGGEYGRAWHTAGMREKKQNVFDDFIAAAEWLIENKYTSSQRLAISGGSNGGLLVGACMTQRPELFAAVLPAVGVMDMLRFHKFTIGWAWVGEYGSSDDKAQFENLLEYSPLHNLKPGVHYPPTLVTTADHDDRVVPAHSFKFIATLQAAQAGPAPVLIRVEVKAGHGAGKPTTKQIEEGADKLAFLVKVLGMKPTFTP